MGLIDQEDDVLGFAAATACLVRQQTVHVFGIHPGGGDIGPHLEDVFGAAALHVLLGLFHVPQEDLALVVSDRVVWEKRHIIPMKCL